MVVRELLTVLGVRADDKAVALFDKAVQQASRDMSAASTKGLTLATTMGNLLAGGFRMAANAGRGLVQSFLETNFEAENLQATLQTMLGESGAALAFDQIKAFSAKTPFQLAGVTKAFIDLKGIGIEPTNEAMNSIGSIAAGRGADITDMSAAVVGAVTGETERLKALGIVSQINGNKISFTYANVKTTVNRDTASIMGYFNELSKTKFGDALERQSATLGGQLSMLKDGVSLFFLSIGQQGGLNDALRDLMFSLTGVTGDASGLSVVIGRWLTGAVRKLTSGIEWLRRNTDTVIKTFKVLGSVLVGLALFKVGEGFVKLTAVVRNLDAAAKLLSLKFLLIGAAVALVILVLDDLISFAQGDESVIGRILPEGEAAKLRAGLLTIWESLSKVGEALSDAFGDVSLIDIFVGVIVGATAIIVEFTNGLLVIGNAIGIASAAAYLFFVEDLPQWIRDAVTWVGDLFEPFAFVIAQLEKLDQLMGVKAGKSVYRTTETKLSNEADRLRASLGGATPTTELGKKLLSAKAPVESQHQLDIRAAMNMSKPSSVNVGAINVTVQGSTNMKEPQLSKAMAKGTSDAVKRSHREADRAFTGGT